VAIGFFPHGTGYLVAGSGSGAKQDLQWFRNLRAAAHDQIQIGATHIDADVRIAENRERDKLWHEVILAQDPQRRGAGLRRAWFAWRRGARSAP